MNSRTNTATEKYADLDAAIITRIRGGFSRFYEIWPAVQDLAKPHISGPHGGPERVVDRRLQALRKQRKITYYGSRWSVL